MALNETSLVERQNKLWNRMQEITSAAESEGRDLSAEERKNWDAAEAELTEVSKDIDRARRMSELAGVDRSQHLAVSGEEEDREGDAEARRTADYAAAFTRYLRGGMESVEPEQRRLLAENRAQATTPGSAGGYLVPEEFRNVLAETLEAFGGLLNEANVIPTSTGAPLSWPTNDDTTNEGAILGQNTQIGEQDMAFGERTLNAYTYTSKLVRVPWQLLQDSAFNLEQWLPEKLGQRIGRIVAKHLISGTGTNQPTGVATNVTVGKTGAAGQVSTILYDDLVDLEHSVNRAYRVNAKYGMSDAALKVLRKLKDGDGRPIWQPIPAPGFPATINGWSYFLDDGFAAPGAEAKSILFGDFKLGYIVRQVRDVQAVRLEERYADYLQTGFFGFARLDGMPDDPAALRAYAHPAE